jgi:hypothetical protein
MVELSVYRTRLCSDSSSFVFELVGVFRTSENGDECGIRLELYSSLGFYLLLCAACPTSRLIPKVSNPVPTATWPDTTTQYSSFIQWRTQEFFRGVVTSGIFFGGGSTNSVEDKGQREWGCGDGSPLGRVSTRFSNE